MGCGHAYRLRSLPETWRETFDGALGSWGATDERGQAWTVDSIWADLRSRRPTDGSLTDWAAESVPYYDAMYPDGAVARALLTVHGLSPEGEHGAEQLRDLAGVLIAYDMLSREPRTGAPAPGGRRLADLAVSEMVELAKGAGPMQRTDRLHGGPRLVNRAASELATCQERSLLPVVGEDTAERFAHIAVQEGLMPHGWDTADLSSPRFRRLELEAQDLTDPSNDYVQRRAAEGYDNVTSALRRANNRIAENQRSRASLAQNLDRGVITNALDAVATLRGEVDMELEELCDIVEAVAQSASEDAVARLIEGDAFGRAGRRRSLHHRSG